MSDLMLLGILRMPLNMVESNPLTLMQFVQCANGAADRIESDARLIEQLREDIQAAKLLAHANGEMFRAEKIDNERMRCVLDAIRKYFMGAGSFEELHTALMEYEGTIGDVTSIRVI
ncbi:TPA: hypothetical protein QDC06_000252 [Burkholderia cepacia]|nr:hypothetical protein BZY94_06285 [Burkholderia territorii]HDR9497065.1 hypothetical protein [Burkholderia cepacia]